MGEQLSIPGGDVPCIGFYPFTEYGTNRWLIYRNKQGFLELFRTTYDKQENPVINRRITNIKTLEELPAFMTKKRKRRKRSKSIQLSLTDQ